MCIANKRELLQSPCEREVQCLTTSMYVPLVWCKSIWHLGYIEQDGQWSTKFILKTLVRYLTSLGNKQNQNDRFTSNTSEDILWITFDEHECFLFITYHIKTSQIFFASMYMLARQMVRTFR